MAFSPYKWRRSSIDYLSDGAERAMIDLKDRLFITQLGVVDSTRKICLLGEGVTVALTTVNYWETEQRVPTHKTTTEKSKEDV